MEPKGQTFTPLRQGRFRINGTTGKKGIVSRRVATRIRQQKQRGRIQTQTQVEVPKGPRPLLAVFRKVRGGIWPYVYCPFCGHSCDPAYPGKEECPKCHSQFLIVKHEDDLEMEEVSKRSDGSVQCPLCGRVNYGLQPGEARCKICNGPFVVLMYTPASHLRVYKDRVPANHYAY